MGRRPCFIRLGCGFVATKATDLAHFADRAFEPLWVEALPATKNAVGLCFQLIFLNFLACFAVYALLVLSKWTRLAFGITLAKTDEEGEADPGKAGGRGPEP